MPKLIVDDLTHEEFHDHIENHNNARETAKNWGLPYGHHEKQAPTHPKGDGHVYHKHKDHTPAARSASLFVLPDLAFAIMFIIAVGMQLAFCWSYGYSAATVDDDNVSEGRGNYQQVIAVAVGVAVLSSFAFIKFMVYAGAGLIKCMLFSCVGIVLAMGFVCCALGQPELSIPFWVLGGGTGLYFICYRGHLEFAGACLEISSQIVAQNPATEFVALGMVLVQAAWSMVFSSALIGLQVYIKEDPHQPLQNYGIMWVGIILTFYWGQQVIRNIVVCTTAGTTASWWFNRDHTQRHPTWDAFWRACTTSLGAIAFGSFFVAIIQTAAYVLNKLKRYLDKSGCHLLACVVRCVVCCVRCIQKCLEIFNFYCYVVVGIYGYGYLHAGAHVLSIFASKGLLLAEEGTLVELVLLLGTGVVALVTGASGALTVHRNPELVEGIYYPVTTTMLCCTIIGHGIAQTMFGVLEAANATVFVCYVENPHALHNDHPKAYLKLHKAWLSMGKTEREHDVGEKYEETNAEREAEGVAPFSFNEGGKGPGRA